jgi:S-adenosylmethionine decarboxylase proenzyme
MKTLGRHLVVDLYDCKSEILNDVHQIEEVMMEAARRCKATPLGKFFHTFEPQGVSGVVVIAESHLAIHTWPEYNFASVDIFTCGNTVDPWLAHEYLTAILKAKSVDVTELKRGTLVKEKNTCVSVSE